MGNSRAKINQGEWDALRQQYIKGGDDLTYASLSEMSGVATGWIKQVASEERPTWNEQRQIWRKHQALAAIAAPEKPTPKPKKPRKRKGATDIEASEAEAELAKEKRLQIRKIAAESATILETVEESVKQLIDPTQMINTHIAIARLLQAKLVKRLRTLDPEEISIRDLPVLLKTAVDIERLSLGMATDLKIIGGLAPTDQPPTKIEIIAGQMPTLPDSDRPLKSADPIDTLADTIDQRLAPTQIEIAIRADPVGG